MNVVYLFFGVQDKSCFEGKDKFVCETLLQMNISAFCHRNIRDLNTSSRPEPDSQYGRSASCEHKERTEGDYRKCVHAIN